MSRLEHPDHLKAQEYRAKAIEALEHATRTKDPEVRTSWEFIATSYHDMAERLERRRKT